jgi:predicted Zn-dependent protease with MMP-like domain
MSFFEAIQGYLNHINIKSLDDIAVILQIHSICYYFGIKSSRVTLFQNIFDDFVLLTSSEQWLSSE